MTHRQTEAGFRFGSSLIVKAGRTEVDGQYAAILEKGRQADVLRSRNITMSVAMKGEETRGV